MKVYLVHWKFAHGGGEVLVVVDETSVSNPKAHAIDLAMNKATTIHAGATFFTLEEIPLNHGVHWINEWYE